VSTIPTNKSEIIDLMAEQAGISKVAATRAFSSVIDGIVSALRSGKQVSIVGFGNFVVKNRAPRKGRNPQTGAEIDIPAANVPAFKPGKALKDAVNSGTVVVEEKA
jgi:DNA-binding protein HU-beta